MKFGTFGLEVDSRDLSSVAFGPLCCMGMTLLCSALIRLRTVPSQKRWKFGVV